MIACVRIPYFAAAVEAREQPELTGTAFLLSQPADTPHDVFACSPAAAAGGIAPGVVLSEARALMPGIRLLPTAPARYRRALDDVLALLASFTPDVEAVTAPDLRADARRRRTPYQLPVNQFDGEQSTLCYADLGSLVADQAQVAALGILRTLREQIHLSAVVGLANGKFPAYVATLAPGYDIVAIKQGGEGDFLADYPASLLPVDGETLRQLDLLGLHMLGQIAALPAAALTDRFGKAGPIMHRLACGRDTSRITPYQPRRRIRHEHTFDGAVTHRAALKAACEKVGEQLSAHLQQDGTAAHDLTLILELEDGTTREQAVALRQPTANASHLIRTAADLLNRVRLSAPVSRIAVEASGLVEPTARQLSLFEREPVPAERLADAIRALSVRHAHAAFFRLVLDDPDAPLPEQRFRLERV